ncbi:MAG TPA: dihydropteroate synthase, partial [bacterium]|nr:dihydropteroate synthase [bacterium]
MTELNELYWAWALVPLPARDALGGAAGLRIRLIAPEGPLRRAAAKFLQIGGTSSDPAPASPPLQDKIQVVLAGSLEQFERMVGGAEALVATALRRTLQAVTAPPPVVTLGKHRFDFATHVYVAGILNNTPDSFYDRGRFYGKDAALARAEEIVREGADVIEV